MPLRKTTMMIGVLLVILTACSSQSTAEKMYEHLEEAVVLENDFADQQQPLVELEKQEKELYNQIISLGMEEFDQVKKLSQEALNLIDKRADRLATEKESIEAAKAEFDKVDSLIEDLDEEKVRTAAEDMAATMDERYSAYQDLNKAYSSALEQDRKLYEMLQNKELKEQELRDQIDSINASYDQVISANQAFNEKTEKYNQLKQKFYELAELNVEYEKQGESNSKEEDSETKDEKETEQPADSEKSN
ncbi:YkyA family protein [Sediminibacillus albus]|uniref:Putative cell-wall binding lipoprotein n=1 Tax=Sediminibacillus albus TaxID=407036 RepID=A0A1G8WB27_9BACI|nr:YkyA family protein [Sediminibacillus albus]SDJ75413.1 Putative cell-wall binding lipoprotein [Sediminibacillus albus]